MKPLVRTTFNTENLNKATANYLKENPLEEIWVNDLYQVNVRRNLPCGWKDENGNEIFITHLSIKNKDRSAKVDWRNFQYIKNQLVGEEHEGCEIYPAESRLVDGANQWHLWIFENTEIRFPFGFNERIVSEKSFIGETQRPFHYKRKPKDLKECEEKLNVIFDKLKNEDNEQ